MKKKIILRSISGFPIGLAIGYLLTIVFSLIWADGYYSPCVPELTATMGNEINAVMLQAFLCGILGSSFAGTSVIWQIDDWGLVKQTGVYFLINSVVMMPTAYITHWMEHSLIGVLSYFGTFFFVFVIIWIIQFSIAKRNVKKLNETLYQKRDS